MPAPEREMKMLCDVLDRVDSELLCRIWLFFRPYFKGDSACLDFLHSAYMIEPVCTLSDDLLHVLDDGTQVDDSLFIPRRMLNTVQRLVSAARDMEMIRKGKDVFKIIYIITCIESLMKLAGENGSKKEVIFNFVTKNISDLDKELIVKRFSHVSDDFEIDSSNDDAKLLQFLGVLNELRNIGIHEGDLWDAVFGDHEQPLIFCVNLDIEKFSTKNKKPHCFKSKLTYGEFEAIIVRTAISFIADYVRNQRSKIHADA